MLKELVKAIAENDMPYNMKVACLCQAGIESGIFAAMPSLLAQYHLNFWALKWRPEMAGYAQPIKYQAHDGTETYCKFASIRAAVEGYVHFIQREPYHGFEKYLFRADSYLTFIGPMFCPPGFTDEWAEKHGGQFYDEYCIRKFCTQSIELIDEYQNEPEPTPEPSPGKKLRILLDPGHSKSDPGAISPNKKVKEYSLNLAQAEHIKAALTEHHVDIYDPNPDNLRDVGRHAKGYDFFIALHHNSYSGTGEPGVEVFTTRDAMEVCKRFAASISARIAKALNIPDRGHKEAGFTVINEATKHCNMSVLVESHFITDEHTYSIALAKSLRASTEIIESIRVYAATVEPIEEKYPVWEGVREFPKDQNIKLAPNFYLQEFACKCNKCDVIKLDYLQLQRLQQLRNKFKQPLVIHSGYRCSHHNAEIGGAKNSQHMYGRATDFHIKNNSLSHIRDAIFELWENGGIGTYSSFYHTDTGPKRRW